MRHLAANQRRASNRQSSPSSAPSVSAPSVSAVSLMNAEELTDTASQVAPQPVLAVNGLSVNLGGRPVLRDISIAATAGTLVGLVGPNGAGKTTLMRAILGLTQPVSGNVFVHGKRPHSRDIGYVPQRHAFAWDFPISVRGVVLSGRTPDIGWLRRAKRADYAAVNEALELTKLSALADRPIAELSGGQRQRVLVARALARRPELLLLDEPFTGLDMPSQESLTTLFTEIVAAGRTIIMSTHDLTAAVTDCDEIWLLNRSLIAAGPPAHLADASLWMRTFEVSEHNHLIRAVLAITAPPAVGSAPRTAPTPVPVPANPAPNTPLAPTEPTC